MFVFFAETLDISPCTGCCRRLIKDKNNSNEMRNKHIEYNSQESPKLIFIKVTFMRAPLQQTQLHVSRPNKGSNM